MIKSPAWAYLDTMVKSRRQVEFKSIIGGGYSVCLKGYEFGTGDTCKKALLKAVKSSNKRRYHAR